MTAKEFETAYINARRRTPTLIRSAMKDIKLAYIDASEKIANDLLNSTGIATERLESIKSQLSSAQQSIAAAIEKGTLQAVDKVTGLYGAITENLLQDLISDTVITKDGIRSMVVGVNQRIISETINRMGQDGYRLSARVWNTAGDYQEQITRLITSGQAQGRTITEIARDLGDYTKGGLSKIPKGYTQAKYGNLVVKNVDWKALRLVRSEVGISQKLSAVAQGEANPSCTKMYNWVRINTQQHDCICPDLAAGSPYKTEDVPVQPHPNCFCQVRPILMDLSQFESDLQKWSDGESVPYIDEWYRTQYS